jgi:oligosaccharyltransferase complex subunit beta
MVYTIKLQELRAGKWVPFTPKDAQFEVVMLDPYVRRTMKKQGDSLVAHFKLPDVHGVYTFKFSYIRKGYTFIDVKETVQVRPFRHDQYPRFLPVAYPYYINLFSMMAGFLVFSLVFLYGKFAEEKVKSE